MNHHKQGACSKRPARLREAAPGLRSRRATSAEEARRSQVQQGRRGFGARSVHGVREDDKDPRTPLADLFNRTIHGKKGQ